MYRSLASNCTSTVGRAVGEVAENRYSLSFPEYLEACGKSASLESNHFTNLFTRIRAASLASKVAEMAYTFEKYLPSTVRKVATISGSQLDLSIQAASDYTDVVQESLIRLAHGDRAIPLATRSVYDTIPDHVLKFASILVVCDAFGGSETSRFITYGKNSTRLRI